MTLQQIAGLIAAVPVPIAVLILIAMVTRPWNVKPRKIRPETCSATNAAEPLFWQGIAQGIDISRQEVS